MPCPVSAAFAAYAAGILKKFKLNVKAIIEKIVKK
jgi:hypothetical protein